jgi:hypothetical protein
MVARSDTRSCGNGALPPHHEGPGRPPTAAIIDARRDSFDVTAGARRHRGPGRLFVEVVGFLHLDFLVDEFALPDALAA